MIFQNDAFSRVERCCPIFLHGGGIKWSPPRPKKCYLETNNGIVWDPDTNLWVAYIFYSGKQRNLGRYRCPEDAKAARKHTEELAGECND